MAEGKHESGNTIQRKIIVKSGYLFKGGIPKKRRKFFQLVKSEDDFVILEYFDQEPPADSKSIYKASRKTINISFTFAISRKSFSSKASSSSNNELSSWKHAHVFHIYTWHHCFSYACDSEESLNEWMEALVSGRESSISTLVAEGRDAALFSPIRYDHVWQVTVKSVKRDPKSKPCNSECELFTGVIRICFLCAHKNLYFYKVCPSLKDVYSCVPPSPLPKPLDIQLNHIRKIGHNNNIFSIETGRGAPFGSLTLNVAADDKFTAECMHETILEAMKPDTTVPLTDKPRRQTMHSYQTSGVRSLGATMSDLSSTLSEPDKISFEPVNDEYVDCDSFYSSDTFRDRAETLPQRTRFWSEGTEYTDVTIVPFAQAMPQLAQHQSTLSGGGAYFTPPQLPQSMLINSQQSSTSRGSFDCEDEEGYLPMCAPSLASQSFCCSSPSSSSMRPSRAYSYGSRPPPVSGSRTQIPTRSSILSSLNNSLSNASLNETNSESREEPCDFINERNPAPVSSLSAAANKSTKSSSVPVLVQPAPRERSSTVGSRPNKKIK